MACGPRGLGYRSEAFLIRDGRRRPEDSTWRVQAVNDRVILARRCGLSARAWSLGSSSPTPEFILDVERDRVPVRAEAHAELLGRHHRERQAARLELGARHLPVARSARQTEDGAEELTDASKFRVGTTTKSTPVTSEVDVAMSFLSGGVRPGGVRRDIPRARRPWSSSPPHRPQRRRAGFLPSARAAAPTVPAPP